MDYKEKYEQALERMKSWASGEHPECFSEAQKAAEFIFPELAESEDERMKEAIIATIHLYYGEPLEDEAKEMISWIEKQGEKLTPKLEESENEKIRKAILACCSDHGHKYQYTGIAVHDMLRWLEKQGKQPTNKIEPKFKVGDWITNGDYTWKIVEVKPLDYILQSQDGNIVDDTISYVDEHFHL